MQSAGINHVHSCVLCICSVCQSALSKGRSLSHWDNVVPLICPNVTLAEHLGCSGHSRYPPNSIILCLIFILMSHHRGTWMAQVPWWGLCSVHMPFWLAQLPLFLPVWLDQEVLKCPCGHSKCPPILCFVFVTVTHQRCTWIAQSPLWLAQVPL